MARSSSSALTATIAQAAQTFQQTIQQAAAAEVQRLMGGVVAAPGIQGAVAPVPRAQRSTNASTGNARQTPEEVAALKTEIVQKLQGAGQHVSSPQLFELVGGNYTRSQFDYALNALKRDGAVQQIGERRAAVYTMPAPKAASRKKAPAAKAKPTAKTGRKNAKALAPQGAGNPLHAEAAATA